MIIDHWWTNASQENITIILAKVRAMGDAACGDERPPIGSDLSGWELNALASLFVAQREALKRLRDCVTPYGEVSTDSTIAAVKMADQLLDDRYPMGTAP